MKFILSFVLNICVTIGDPIIKSGWDPINRSNISVFPQKIAYLH